MGFIYLKDNYEQGLNVKLTSIHLRNFRCYADSGVMPIHDMTIFIGGNDCGKSSILRALNIFFKNEKQVIENFRKVNEIREKACEIELIFDLEADDTMGEYQQYNVEKKLTMKKVYEMGDTDNITEKFLVKQYAFKIADLNRIDALKATELRPLCSMCGIDYKTVETTKGELAQYVKQNFDKLPKEESYAEADWLKLSILIPAFELYDSSNYGNPQSVVEKTLSSVYRSYFYKIENGIEKLIPDFVSRKEQIETDLNRKIEDDLKTKIQQTNSKIKNVTGRFSIDFAQGFRLDTILVDYGNGVRPLQFVGEGSKKRLFLAINEWDREIRRKDSSKRRIIRGYDEPDASLHYAAQKEMYYNLKERSEDSEDKLQVIICTHSIAMVDRAPPGIINHIQNEGDQSSVDYLQGGEDQEIKEFLDSISEISGIKNSSLFFERCFLIVEGDAEDNFLPVAYKKITGHTLAQDGIVLINLKGNSAWQQFLKLLSKNKTDATVLMLDSDVQITTDAKVTKDKLKQIGFSEQFLSNNVFFIGNKEFEDIFSDAIICRCLNRYWMKISGETWTIQEIQSIRGLTKFSNELTKIVEGYRTSHPVSYSHFGKPEFGRKMAEEITAKEFNDIKNFNQLINKLKQITD